MARGLDVTPFGAKEGMVDGAWVSIPKGDVVRVTVRRGSAPRVSRMTPCRRFRADFSRCLSLRIGFDGETTHFRQEAKVVDTGLKSSRAVSRTQRPAATPTDTTGDRPVGGSMLGDRHDSGDARTPRRPALVPILRPIRDGQFPKARTNLVVARELIQGPVERSRPWS